ncbi:hypothetical protein IJ670_04455, partial [bacterium]|nr:hypothetical protein [bacterium]
MGALGLGASFVLTSKNDKIYQKTKPIIDNINKWFKFNQDNNLEKIHYGALIYPASILGYFKASRDKYEI